MAESIDTHIQYAYNTVAGLHILHMLQPLRRKSPRQVHIFHTMQVHLLLEVAQQYSAHKKHFLLHMLHLAGHKQNNSLHTHNQIWHNSIARCS